MPFVGVAVAWAPVAAVPVVVGVTAPLVGVAVLGVPVVVAVTVPLVGVTVPLVGVAPNRRLGWRLHRDGDLFPRVGETWAKAVGIPRAFISGLT